MIGLRLRRRKGYALVLLLAQLTGTVLGVMHAAAPGQREVLHAEGPKSHQNGHDDAACPVCRHPDTRSAAAAGAPMPALAAGGSQVARPVAAAPLPTRPLVVSGAPRGPPPPLLSLPAA